MDGTTNNFTWSNEMTSSTECDTMWFDGFTYTSWLPYKYEQYHPKWHIKQGYKNQMKHMWEE